LIRGKKYSRSTSTTGSQLEQMLFEYQEQRLHKQMSELELNNRRADDELVRVLGFIFSKRLIEINSLSVVMELSLRSFKVR
jgi:hypothetical protein